MLLHTLYHHITKALFAKVAFTPYVHYTQLSTKKLQFKNYNKKEQFEKTDQTSEPDSEQRCWNYQTEFKTTMIKML